MIFELEIDQTKAQPTTQRALLRFENNNFKSRQDGTLMVGFFDGIDGQFYRNSHIQIYEISKAQNRTASIE
jgi:hypothetical protein